jgi:Arc/MetJ-type ribon-helix-helix transcriptional regulator
MEKDTYIRIRCSKAFKQMLKQAIAEGKAKNMSQLIRKAIEKTLQT